MNTIIATFLKGVEKSGLDRVKISVPSDIPFAPDEIRNLGVDFFHVPRGRAIAFGTGMKLANPNLRVVTFTGDLMTIGGNHFVHASRRNMELLVICVNNFIYRKIAGTTAPAVASVFSPYSTFEQPFNIPHLGNSCGAVYTARWTALHSEELANSIAEALSKPGLSLIEILAPGPDYYSGIGNIKSDLIKFYYENSIVKNGEDPRNVEINDETQIIVGRFTNKEGRSFIDIYNAQHLKTLGNKFTPYGNVK